MKSAWHGSLLALAGLTAVLPLAAQAPPAKAPPASTVKPDDDRLDFVFLGSTLIVWMGEFGRTPKINQSNGRDHYPNACATVLAGGGITGGTVHGKTSKDGTTVEEGPVTVPDLVATVCKALGIDPEKQNQSNVGRPIRIADRGAKPVQAVLA